MKQPDIYFEDSNTNKAARQNGHPEGDEEDDESNGELDDYAEEDEDVEPDNNENNNGPDSECSPVPNKKKALKNDFEGTDSKT